MKYALVFFAALALGGGPALADTAAVAPSAVVASPSTYDNQDVTVTGTVKNITTQDTPRGTMTRYQICDAQCVNVVQFTGTAPAQGQSQTVTGRFRANVSHGHMQATNVIIIMPPGGWKHDPH